VTEDRPADGAPVAQPVRMRRVWYWQPGKVYALMALELVFLGLMTAAISSTLASAQLALILCGAEVLAAAVLGAALSPVIMLRQDLIRIWHGFKFVNIGTSEVAGIGMLCTRGPGGGPLMSVRWRLYIWRADGTGERTSYFYVPRPGHWLSLKAASQFYPSTYDPVAASEIPGLNASRPATVARDLEHRLLAAQGADGPLATMHLEQRSRALRLDRYDRVIAYWSPGGQTGHR
jgi:hypothetical protein